MNTHRRGFLYALSVSYGYIALQMLTVLVRTKLLTTFLSKPDFYFLNTAAGTLGLVAVMLSLGSFEYILKTLPGLGDGERLSLTGGLLRGVGGLSVAATALLVVLGLLFQSFVLPPAAWLTAGEWVAAGLGSVLWGHLIQRQNLLMAAHQAGRYRLLQFLYAECWFLPVLALAAPAGTARPALLWAWTGWMALVAVLTARFVPYAPALRAPRDPRFALAPLAAFGLPLLPLLAGEQVFRLVDRYFMGGLHGEEAGAEYTLCMNVAMIAYLAGNSILMLIVPRFNQRREALRGAGRAPGPDDPALRTLFCQLLRYGWVFALAAGAVFVGAGESVLRVLADPRYASAAPMLAWAAPVSFWFVTFAVLTRVLIGFDRTRRVGLITLAGAALNLGLNALLTPRLAGIGAALANVLALAAMCIAAGRAIGFARWVDADVLKPGRLLLFLALALAAAFAAPHLPGGPLVHLAACGLVLLVLIPALRLITREELVGLFAAPSSP